ncbi:MAG: NAD(P)/FAD-dependent oxidoreductase [Candidatus Omnitrophica bacterium]|nr:NAD(P)/FAD-dependent oxidoreductase [Candidatus Omnitrophota bacterium]
MKVSAAMDRPVDIAIIGAGAAGLMTAIWAGRTAQARQASIQILLLDTREKIGAKILMSGGTRCNVTNQKVKPSDFQGGPSHFVKHILEAFTPQKTIRFFKEIGVELILEPSGKYFPATHSAQTVLDVLMKEAKRVGITLERGVRITEITKAEGLFHLKSADGAYQISARKVVLTTGGLSYPTTGSDGTGYEIAKSFGHMVVNTFPALTPLLTNDNDWKNLSGVSLEAKLSFFKNGKKECDYYGSFLFTHFGFSGPAALDISRHFASAAQNENVQIIASFLPHFTEKSLKIAFGAGQKKNPGKLAKTFLAEEFSLPERFAKTFVRKIGVSETDSIGKCSGENCKKLIRLLLNYPLEITGVFGYKKAEVTAGGVDLKEVKVQTMESKLADGLFFAGEILDVDGRIGGFNFQWAWSTGAAAGRSAAWSLTS